MNRDQLLNDTETAIRTGLDGKQAQIWTALPCLITSVDLLTMTLEAQPTIQGVVTNPDDSEDFVTLPTLVDVPMVFPNGGGFVLTFPVNIGDECLVIFSSRCIDSWWQSGGIGKPIESRMHDLSDGFALVGPKSLPHVIPAISSTAVQLRNFLGTSVIGLSGSGLLQAKNATGDLKTALNGMLDLLSNLEIALTSFSATAATDPIAIVTASAATTLQAQLGVLSALIPVYKTVVIGGLLE